MAEGKPGDGFKSPFGDGNGATQAVGPSTGGFNFLKNPQGDPNPGKGRNFTAESRPQPAMTTADEAIDQTSKPAGSEFPLQVLPNPEEMTDGDAAKVDRMPFKNLK